MLPLTSYPLTCSLDSTCNKVSCCVDSGFTNSTFEVVFDLNHCTRMLSLEIEDLKVQIPFSEIQWGKYYYTALLLNFRNRFVIMIKLIMMHHLIIRVINIVEMPSNFYLNSVVRLE